MVLVANDVVWMEGGGATALEEEEEDVVSSWTRNHNNDNQVEPKAEDFGINGSLSTSLKSMLETDWFINSDVNPSSHHDLLALQNQHDIRGLSFCSNPTPESLLLQSMDSSSSCSPSQAFTLDPSQSHQPFLLPKSCFSSLLNVTNPFDNGFDLCCETAFLGQYHPNQATNLMGFSGSEFQASQLLPLHDSAATVGGSGFGNVGLEGFDGSSANAMSLSRAKVLRPLEVLPPVGSRPTLFQKRAMLRQSGNKLGNLKVSR